MESQWKYSRLYRSGFPYLPLALVPTETYQNQEKKNFNDFFFQTPLIFFWANANEKHYYYNQLHTKIYENQEEKNGFSNVGF